MKNVINKKATGLKISQAMQKKSITVCQLAEFLGVSCQAVYKFMKGQSIPSTRNLFAISQILGVSMENLLVLNAGFLNN